MDAGVGVGEKREKGREEGEGGGVGLPPQKLVRGQASLPFRMVSPAPAPASAPRPAGPIFFYGNGCDQNQGARALQPLPTPFASSDRARVLLASAGAADAAVAGLRSFPFTQAQWQELQRQAMIYKHFVASVPVPAELLFPISAASFSDAPFHFLPRTHGGACVNVRFGSGVDPEPGRCRRTDGKKWRCSRDVAPGQKYCERHVHRGRPRSRKPVELHKTKTAPITPAPAAASPTSPAADNPPSRTTTASSLSQPFPVRSTSVIPKPPEMKLPFLSMEPNKDPRHLDWMKNDGEDMASSQHWELMQSKISSRSNTRSVMHHYEEELNLNYTDLNDPCFPFLNPDLSSLEEGTIVNHRDPPRSFIDAWSSEGSATTSGKSSVTSAGKLPLSTLSLSIRGIEEDVEQVQMGLGLGDAATSSWMAPGPLGEALQSSNGTSPPNGSRCSKGSCSGLMSLMGKGCSGSQVASPQGSPTTLASSPSGVLHKALVSLSDSSCSSSPTFAAAAASPGEFTLQWMNQSSK